MRKIVELLNKTNGWQRAWIVLGVVWLVCSAIFAATRFPTESSMRSTLWENRSSDPALSALDPKKIAEHCEANFSNSYGSCLIANSYGERVNAYGEQLARTREREDQYIEENLLIEQARAMGFAILFWLVPVFAAYALGMAVAWIIRGFRK